MTPERMQQIQEIYLLACERPAAERESFVRILCGSDAELFGAVQALIVAQSTSVGFLETPVIEMAASLLADAGSGRWNSGARVGPFEIVEQLGAGGMGEVYKARDTRLDRPVAIKVLPDYIATRKDARERFEREARTVASLNHPNICTLYDIGPSYMVMELIEGETLAARIAKGPIPLEQAIAWAVQIADALDRAHRAGVTHRDVKPGNIMITCDGAKVLDFGLAKRAHQSGSAASTVTAALTSEGSVLGTPQYMAPEQFEGKEADARSDVWAFGTVLYEMVTGRKAFEGKSYPSLVAAVLSAELPPMAVNRFTPPWLERLVRRCLQKDPENRWQTMRDVVIELKSPPDSRKALSASGIGWAVAVVSALVLMFFAGAYFSRKGGAAGSDPHRILMQIAPPDGTFRKMLLSPDGRHLLIATGRGTGAGAAKLWIRSFDSLGTRLLMDIDRLGTVLPAWSPDSEQIAYYSFGKLFRIARSGGVPVQIAEAPFEPQGPFAIVWLADYIVASSPGGVFRFPLAGGPYTKLDDKPARFVSSFPSDRYLVGRKDGLFVRSLSGDSQVQITSETFDMAEFVPSPDARKPGYLVFTRGNRTMAQALNPEHPQLQGAPVPILNNEAFSVSASGVLAARRRNNRYVLTWLDRQGRELQRLGTPFQLPPNPYISLSPDDSRALVPVVAPDGTHDAWMADVAGGSLSRMTFLNSSLPVFGIFSPDGRKVLWASPDGKRYLRPADGSGQDELVFQNPSGQLFVWDWTPDGKLIATGYTGKTARFDIWLFSVLGDRKLYPYIESDNATFWARFSPDSRWMAYVSEQYGLPYQVFVESIPRGSGRWQVSGEEGGDWPIWRRDGKELFYTRGQTIMSVPVKLSASAVEFGKPVALFESKQTRFQVSRDGQRFLVALPAGGQEDQMITIDTNWRARLKE